jgi:carbon storage regulator CsrA
MEDKIMLVLSRKADESIHIGGRIKIRIVKIKGNRVRIGIEAPEDVAIVRGELADLSDFSIDDFSHSAQIEFNVPRLNVGS